MASSLREIAVHLSGEYKRTTSKKVQLIDSFLVYAFAMGAIQVLYMLLVGQFPFNSFLSGFVAAAGFFAFTVCLRMQLLNPQDFNNISAERACADYVLCNIVLLFVVITFMG